MVLVSFLLFTWWACAQTTQSAEDSLGGVWTANGDEFCMLADISAMMLVIGEPVNPSGRWNVFGQVIRPAQLVIMDGVHAGSFDMTYRKGATLRPNKYEITAELSSDEPILWDGPIKITLDIPRGLMVILDCNDDVVAALARDNAATEACAE